MAIYSIAGVAIGAGGNFSAASAGTAGPLFELYTTSTDRPRLMEMSITYFPPVIGFNVAWGLGRPATVGTPASGYVVNPIPDDDQSPPSNVSMGVAWTTRPTAPANFFRRIQALSNSGIQGGGRVWKFPNGIVISPSSSLVFWCPSSGAAQVDAVPCTVSLVIDE